MSSMLQESLNIKNDFALYKSIKSVKGAQAYKSLRNITERLSTPIETADKDTYLIGPYKLGTEAKRANSNIESVSALVFDIDNPKNHSFDDIVALTSNYLGLIHTTWSHTTEAPRYRVVIHLQSEVPARDFAEVRRSFLMFNQELASIVDQSCSDISRAYYWFSYPKNRAHEAMCCVLIGNPLDPNALLKPKNHVPFLNNLTDHPTNIETLLKLDINEGSRNKTLASLIGGLILRGLNQNETLRTALEWNSNLTKPLPIDEVQRTHNSIWNTHQRNHLNTEYHIDRKNETHNKTFKLIPAQKLLAAPPPARDWVIQNFLPKKIVAAIIAAGGTGKSYLAMHIAISAATGTALFNKYQPKEPEKVVFISGEDDSTELQRRLHKAAKGLAVQEKILLDKNLHFIDLADSFELFTEKNRQGETIITQNPKLICDSITAHLGTDIGLVIVDPISRFRGGEENLATDSTRFVQALQEIRDHLKAAVLCLHHVNKSAGAGGNQNNSRGSSAFIDGVRLVFQLNAMADKDIKNSYGSQIGIPQLLSLQSVKSNYGKAIEPLIIARREDGALEPFNMLLENIQEKRLLEDIEKNKLSKTQFKELFGGIKNKFGLAEKALVEKIEEMGRAGLIHIPKRNVMTLTDSGRKALST